MMNGQQNVKVKKIFNWKPLTKRSQGRPKILDKYPKINFNYNLFNGGRVLPCGRTDEQTDMRKIIFAFHIFANVSKINKSLVYVKE
jgi:hypothetical protein